MERREIRKRRRTRLDFDIRYNKLKIIKFNSNPNMQGFRAIEKEFIRLPLSASAKAIYIVLCVLSDYDENKPLQVSKENIGVLSGLKDWSTISKALQELSQTGWISSQKVINERRYWVYDVSFIRQKDINKYKPSEYIMFHTCIVESGVWAYLRPKDKALYLTLRAESEFEYDTMDYPDIGFVEAYGMRKFEIYYGRLKELSQKSGVSIGYVKRSIERLQEAGLVIQIQEGMVYYQVNLYPEVLEE